MNAMMGVAIRLHCEVYTDMTYDIPKCNGISVVYLVLSDKLLQRMKCVAVYYAYETE